MSQFLYGSACVVRPLAAAAANTSTLTGAAVDVRDLAGPLIAIQSAGVGAGTDTPTLAGKIQTSADGSTGWVDLAGATFTAATDTAGSQKIIFGKKATLGYVRYVGTITGTNPSFPINVLLIGMQKST
jgi:hypothetical protein